MPNTPKLTPCQRKEISELYNEGRSFGMQSKKKRYKTGLFTCKQIAEIYNVSAACVYYVAVGQR